MAVEISTAAIAKDSTKEVRYMSAYGLWSLVLINSAIFIIFAFSFTRLGCKWVSHGARKKTHSKNLASNTLAMHK